MAKGLTVEQAALMRGSCIDDAFPLEFRNGMRFENPGLECPCCDTAVPSLFVRGQVHEPARQVCEAEIGGYCERCEEFTFTRIRFYDDGRILQLNGRRWEEIEPRMTVLERLRGLLDDLCR